MGERSPSGFTMTSDLNACVNAQKQTKQRSRRQSEIMQRIWGYAPRGGHTQCGRSRPPHWSLTCVHSGPLQSAAVDVFVHSETEGDSTNQRRDHGGFRPVERRRSSQTPSVKPRPQIVIGPDEPAERCAGGTSGSPGQKMWTKKGRGDQRSTRFSTMSQRSVDQIGVSALCWPTLDFIPLCCDPLPDRRHLEDEVGVGGGAGSQGGDDDV